MRYSTQIAAIRRLERHPLTHCANTCRWGSEAQAWMPAKQMCYNAPQMGW